MQMVWRSSLRRSYKQSGIPSPCRGREDHHPLTFATGASLTISQADHMESNHHYCNCLGPTAGEVSTQSAVDDGQICPDVGWEVDRMFCWR